MTEMARSIQSDLVQIFKASCAAVLPQELIRKRLEYDKINDVLSIMGYKIPLHEKKVFMVGAGKAAQFMAREILTLMGPKIEKGIISIPEGSLDPDTKSDTIDYREGAKDNLPDAKAEATAKLIKELAESLSPNDLLLVLLTGGGSALMPLPKKQITLNEKTKLIKKLANSGANINELNIVRKRLSDIKGGKLAMCTDARVVTLIISDIVNNPFDLIASGPTVENTDDPKMAIDILKKYKVYNALPKNIKSVLKKDLEEEITFPSVHNFVKDFEEIAEEIAEEIPKDEASGNDATENQAPSSEPSAAEICIAEDKDYPTKEYKLYNALPNTIKSVLEKDLEEEITFPSVHNFVQDFEEIAEEIPKDEASGNDATENQAPSSESSAAQICIAEDKDYPTKEYKLYNALPNTIKSVLEKDLEEEITFPSVHNFVQDFEEIAEETAEEIAEEIPKDEVSGSDATETEAPSSEPSAAQIYIAEDKEYPTEKVLNFLIGSNETAVRKAYDELMALDGYVPIIISQKVTGDVKEVAQSYYILVQIIGEYFRDRHVSIEFLEAALNTFRIPGMIYNFKYFEKLRDGTAHDKTVCLILAGETTVKVVGKGKGGRNQQLALEFSKILNKNKFNGNVCYVRAFFLSAGTDGIDGPTDAAGAIADLNLYSDSFSAGIDADKYLFNNDCYTFYKNYKNGRYHVKTGHTNTNVMDIHLLAIEKKSQSELNLAIAGYRAGLEFVEPEDTGCISCLPKFKFGR